MAIDETGSSRTPVRGPSPDDPTIGRLVADASRDISTLVSKEIELAKSELKVSVRAGGLGIGLLAGAAFLAVLGVIMLSFTIVYFINWGGSGLALHWAFLIVTVFWFLVTGVAGWIGVKKLKQVTPPEKAIEQGREIPRALRGKGPGASP
jgi:Putative Actinobacterial Holin-X, holin superfamily III